jgi:hypothetical protein
MNFDFGLINSFFAPATIVAVVAVSAFFYEKRRQRIVTLERNFEILQEFNVVSLSSEENLIACLRSVRPDDTTTAPEARKILMQFMRINRLLRAWQFGYRRPRIITENDADEIVDSYVVTLLESEDIIDILLERGYPPRFQSYLKERLELAKKQGKRARPFNKTSSDMP